VVALTKKHPGAALGLAAAGGALAGFNATRLATPSQGEAEKKVRRWVDNAQDGWRQLREGLDQALSSAKGAAGR
jgi:hypothetical protein